MNRKYAKLLAPICILGVQIPLSSCESGDAESVLKSKHAIELRGQGESLDHTLSELRTHLELLGRAAEKIVAAKDRLKGGLMKQEIVSYNGRTFTKQKEGESNAGFSLGSPRGKEQIEMIRALEFLDLFALPMVDSHPEVAYVSYLHPNISRAYPGQDFVSMLPRVGKHVDYMKYQVATPKENPERKPILLAREARLNPVLRDWVIYWVVPIYVGDRFEASLSMNISVKKLTEEAISNHSHNLILSETGRILAVGGDASSLLGLPKLSVKKYTSLITPNLKEKDQFNLLESQFPEIRAAAKRVIEERQDRVVLQIGKKNYVLVAYRLTVAPWIIARLVRQ